MSDIITARDIEIVTAEIKVIEKQVVKAAIYGCIEIGRRLVEAKELVGHGGWGKYLEENVRYSQQWATNLMNLYKEYGSQQESLFESFANSKSFGNIDVTKHILLLAVPAEERAEFAEKNDVENQTVKQLQEAIRQRDDAIQERDSNLQEVVRLKEQNEQITAGMSEAADKLEAKDAQLKSMEQTLKAAQEKENAAEQKIEKLSKQLEKAKEGKAKAEQALAAAKENPDIPESVMEQLRCEVAADAAKKATEEISKELESAKVAAEAAAKDRETIEAQLKKTQEDLLAAQKQVQLANPDMVLVSTYLQGVQDQFKKMLDALKAVKASDPEAGAKMKENVKSKLLEGLAKALETV